MECIIIGPVASIIEDTTLRSFVRFKGSHIKQNLSSTTFLICKVKERRNKFSYDNRGKGLEQNKK